MARTKAPAFSYTTSKLITAKEIVKPVILTLPEAHPRQHYFIDTFNRRPGTRFVVGACGSKFGKAVSLDTPVPTPSGWRTMGDIQEGDYVFGADGRPTLVEFATDPMYNHTCYRVVFSDGSSVVCDAGHLWETRTALCRKAEARVASEKDRCKSTRYAPTVLTTEEIKNSLMFETGGTSRPNHSVDLVSGPLEFKKQDLPLDPYVLGAWLGDGTTGLGDLTCASADKETIEHIRTAGFVVNKHTAEHRWGVVGLASMLRTLGVLENKHVPPQYLVGSVDQRLALLQGLMDTDGTIDKRGHCTFDNTNRHLAEAVQELCHTLGIKTNWAERVGKLNGEEKKRCYRVWFTTDLPVFRLKRKLARVRPVATKAKRRYIVDVQEVPSEPVKCIRVADPRHLFLVGKACIPTHNTYGTIIATAQYAWNNPTATLWWVSPTYMQASYAYGIMKTMLPKDSYKEYKADYKLQLIGPSGQERSTIYFKSGDNPDNLRGFGVNFFVMDEAARCPYDSWVSLLTTVTQTEGIGYLISTPKGRGWFYELYCQGVKEDDDGNPLYAPGEDPHPEWYSMRLPTWTNPHVNMDAIRAMKRTLPEDVFRQEIEAQFLVDSAGVFRGVSHCVRGELHEPVPGQRYVMGVDLARLKDYSVLSVLDRSTRHMVSFERFNQISWEVQYQKIIETAKRYNALVIIDSTGIGDPIVETLSRARINLQPYKISGSVAKQQLIDKLRVAIENQEVSFPNIPILKRELESYEYEVTASGAVRYMPTSGMHDDCVISLALANWGAAQEPYVYHYRNVRGI